MKTTPSKQLRMVNGRPEGKLTSSETVEDIILQLQSYQV